MIQPVHSHARWQPPAPGAELPRSSELGPEWGWQRPVASLQGQGPRTPCPASQLPLPWSFL